MNPPSADALVALRDKYREMLRMRREAGLAHDPKPEMRRLAERFPGALREIDDLPLEEIDRRVRVLDSVVAGESAAPEWAALFVGYHGLLRAALRIKRMCLGCDGLEEAIACVRAGYVPAPDEPSLEELGADAVARITRPEAGRLNPWVFERLAARHCTTPDHVREVLFPPRVIVGDTPR